MKDTQTVSNDTLELALDALCSLYPSMQDKEDVVKLRIRAIAAPQYTGEEK